MTRPFRDPIIYPGEPLETKGGQWHRMSHLGRVCVIGGEPMSAGTLARWRSGAWECRDHARLWLGHVDGEVAA